MAVILRLFVLGVCVAAVSCVMPCPEDYCSTVDCAVAAGDNAPPCREDQRLNEKGTSCGCCPACITQIAEGSMCISRRVFGGPPPVSECAPGLMCSHVTGIAGTCVAREAAVTEKAAADE